MSLESLSVRALLQLNAQTAAELRKRGVTRSSNNPCADYAEGLVSAKLALQLVGKSTRGYDALDAGGQRYEIKARRLAPGSRPTILSTIRGIEDRHFDFLVAVLFNEDYSVRRAVRLPYQSVRQLARFRPHVNGSVLLIRSLWEAEGAEDLTALLAESD